ARHPLLDAATAAGDVTISWAREIAGWTGRIDDEELQGEADRILVDAAAAGADLDDLRLIAQAAYEAWRAREPDPDEDPHGRGFGDRHLSLDTTMDGAGRITGDLTPECAAAVTAVLEALGKRRGPEDLRTAGRRYHDALQEACELLIGAKMVPDRAGAATRVGALATPGVGGPPARPRPPRDRLRLRPHQRQRLRAALQVPSPRPHPPPRLDLRAPP
ncbi:MAG TPA: DUF222 domain-containing protein, partial [Trebonia sp.]|nr:DUF222 domain-containing protein [Trebonia sp.]